MVWDTAGQEEFDAVTRLYYRGERALNPDPEPQPLLPLPLWAHHAYERSRQYSRI